MNLDYRYVEDIDNEEEYEMVPLDSMMYGYGEMSTTPVMGMNHNTGMNPNMGMNPSMGIPAEYMKDPNLGMKPCMGMNQFDDAMLMDGSIPTGMMYTDIDMNNYGDGAVRQQDMREAREPSHDDYNKFDPKYSEVDSIVRRIERNNPAIFRMLTRCRIPYTAAIGLVRRIVRLTLMYSD